jgi:hypothetical protein
MSIFPFSRQLLKENAARFAIINRLDTCMHGGYTFSTHLNWHGGSSKKKKKLLQRIKSTWSLNCDFVVTMQTGARYI